MTILPPDVEQAVLANPVVSDVLRNWGTVELPNSWIVAGAIVQSYWNAVHEFPPLHGIDDVDIVYFDPDDLSEETEATHALRISTLFESAGVRFDVKNQARVHLWYETRFGKPTGAYHSSENAIDTFPTTVGSVGIRPRDGSLEAYATFGFDDLLDLVVRPNKRLVTPDVYAAKVTRWKALWPKLSIVEWDDK